MGSKQINGFLHEKYHLYLSTAISVNETNFVAFLWNNSSKLGY